MLKILSVLSGSALVLLTLFLVIGGAVQHHVSPETYAAIGKYALPFVITMLCIIFVAIGPLFFHFMFYRFFPNVTQQLVASGSRERLFSMLAYGWFAVCAVAIGLFLFSIPKYHPFSDKKGNTINVTQQTDNQ